MVTGALLVVALGVVSISSAAPISFHSKRCIGDDDFWIFDWCSWICGEDSDEESDEEEVSGEEVTSLPSNGNTNATRPANDQPVNGNNQASNGNGRPGNNIQASNGNGQPENNNQGSNGNGQPGNNIQASNGNGQSGNGNGGEGGAEDAEAAAPTEEDE